MPNFPKKQQQCLIPKYLLDYATDLQENHPDPSAEWGGGSGGDTIQAGEGIVITTESDDTKTISVDTEDVAMVADLSSVAFSGDYDDLSNTPTIPTNYVTTNTAQDITDYKRFVGQQYDEYTTISNNRVLVSNYAGDRSTRMENEKVAAHYHWMDTTENMELWADGIHYSNSNNNDTTTVNLNFNVNPYENETYYITFPSKNGTVALTSDIITSYNDLEDKPTIPTATSDLYNDSGFITGITSSDVTTALGYTPYDSSNPSGYITSSALTGYATEYWVGQQGYLTSVTWNDVSGKPTFATVATSGDYDDLINKPTIPDTTHMVTDNTNQTIGGYKTFSNSIEVSKSGVSTVGILDAAALEFNDGSTIVDLVPNSNQPTGLAVVQLPSTTGTLALTSDLPAAVSGTNDGTNWTSLTIGNATYAIPQGSTPSNMVTTNTAQDITGEKTFVGSTRVKFEKSTSSDTLGFTCYDESSKEFCNMQAKTRTVGGVSEQYLTLGNYAAAADGYGHAYVGFRINPTTTSSSYYNFLAPHGTNTEFSNAGYSTSSNNYLVASVTDGTTTVKADALGKVNISSLMPTVPTTATSTSTVTTTTSSFMTSTTKTTETLTFTYADNTTANITIVTGVTDNTSSAMTGATVTTTTTLS